MLPEYWQGFHVSCFAADIWAAAVTLYVLVKGTNPFPIRHLDQHIERMVNYSVTPDLTGFSDELLHLLQLCMSPKLALRPTLDQILVPAGNPSHLGLRLVPQVWVCRRSLAVPAGIGLESRKCASCRVICSVPADVSKIPRDWTNGEMAGLAVGFGGKIERRASSTAAS